MQAAETELEPLLAAHSDSIMQNPMLFQRIEAAYNSRGAAGLSDEQKRLTWVYWNNFVRSGARLDPAAKTRIAQ